MIQKLKVSFIAVTALIGIGVLSPVPAYAATCTTAAECINEGVKTTGTTSSKTSVGSVIKQVVNVLLYILGAVAVIMIVIGGIKYTTSNGDPSAVTSAKNTILYAVIGLIVAMMAFAIVNFVVTEFK